MIGPGGLEFGPNGNLFVVSYYTAQVLEYDGNTGAFITAFVTNGSGGLSFPSDLAFGPNGDLLVTSTANSHPPSPFNQVLDYAKDGTFVAPFVSADSGGLNVPTYLTFGPSVLFNLHIRATSPSGATLTWSTNAVGYVLQLASTIRSLAWTPVTNSHVVVGGEFTVPIGTSASNAFFRLARP